VTALQLKLEAGTPNTAHNIIALDKGFFRVTDMMIYRTPTLPKHQVELVVIKTSNYRYTVMLVNDARPLL